MRLSSVASGAFVVVAVAGCTSVKSSDLKTDGMSAYLRVIGDGTGQTTASAAFNVDNNPTDYVDLSSGDTAVAQAGGQTQTMSRVDDLGAISYQATFSGLDAEGTQYTIALNRTTDVSAPDSTVTMPHPFNITAPTTSGTFSRTMSDIQVTYDNSGSSDQMSWSANGTCINGQPSGTISPDTGTFTIPKGTITPADASQAMATCQVQLSVTRVRQGQIDPHYGSGGNIAAEAMRTVTFNSTP
jgi:hypothetical protein